VADPTLGLVPDGEDGETTNSVDFTNRFETGDLDLLKVVDGPGAELYGAGPFEVHVVCVDETDREVWNGRVTLGGDEPLEHTVTDMYAGASCTVTETLTGGANDTSIDPTGPVVIGTGDDDPVRVTVTNTFDLTSLEITKDIVGGGAEQVPDDREFEVQVVCVRDVDGVEVDVPISDDGRRVLSKAGGLTATVDELPLGATCEVTEVRTGGAHDSSVSPEGPFVADSTEGPVAVTVTNRFDVGAIRVTKRLEGDGVKELSRDLTFAVRVSCVQEVDGEQVGVAVPDGARRELSRATSMRTTYENLPSGAECEVTEPVDRGADSTEITPSTLVVGTDEVAQVEVVNTFDETPGTGGENEDGPGADTGGEVASSGPDALLLAGLAAALMALLGGSLLIRRRKA
jgi:hypothetical protein